jgi:enoyl-CoA hydratase/carnithine racemase
MRASASPPCVPGHAADALVDLPRRAAGREAHAADRRFVSGRDAQRLGLVLKAVPPARLTEEVRALAGRVALIDPDVLAGNKPS